MLCARVWRLHNGGACVVASPWPIFFYLPTPILPL